MGPSYDSAPTSSANSPCIARAPVNGFYTISIPLPFTACQTTNQPRARIDSSNVFTNKVWLNRNGALFDIPVPVITWSCTYTEKYSIVTSLQPAVDPIRNQLSGVIQRQATVELCKVGNACPNACPPMFTVNSGAVYTVSEVIHLTLTVPRPPTDNVVLVKSLYLSCESNPGSKGVSLVTGGCSANVLSTTIGLNGQSNSVCISFRVPRMKGCSSFYIHGELAAAVPNSLQRCSSGVGFVRSAVSGGVSAQVPNDTVISRRKRRDLLVRDASDNSSVVLIGPIFVIDGELGVGSSELFPNASVIVVPKEPPHTTTALSGTAIATAAIGGFALLLLFVTVLSFVYKCRKP
uniref:Uncharacterized protein n=1 Tax=Ciona savignyi TaxID=51511 RepID=H2YJM9_CIOSA